MDTENKSPNPNEEPKLGDVGSTYVEPTEDANDSFVVKKEKKPNPASVMAKKYAAKGQAYAKANPQKTAITIIVLLLLGLSFSILDIDEDIHVSLAAETLLLDGPDWFTNALLHTVVVDLILIVIALIVYRNISLVPGRFQNFIEAVIEYLYSYCEDITGKNARKYSQWVLTIFFFVIVSNWTGLIPGVGSIVVKQDMDLYEELHGESHGMVLDNQIAVADANMLFSFSESAKSAGDDGHGGIVKIPLLRPPTADLNATFALSIAIMALVQMYGIQALGGTYFKKFFNTSGEGFMRAINGYVGILELISEISRVLSFAFRLFGNIFAGEVMLATMAFLITFLLPIPFYGLELFVGFIQAMVFMMLSLIFFALSTVSHADDHH